MRHIINIRTANGTDWLIEVSDLKSANKIRTQLKRLGMTETDVETETVPSRMEDIWDIGVEIRIPGSVVRTYDFTMTGEIADDILEDMGFETLENIGYNAQADYAREKRRIQRGW
jgi:hypothetical protein